MITPIILPVAQPTCPKCAKPERRVSTCGHCGYEYRLAPWTWADVAALGGMALGFLFVMAVSFEWLLSYPGDATLVEAIVKVAGLFLDPFTRLW